MEQVNKLTQSEVNLDDKSSDIAVVGIGCRYPGAETAQQLWENILARRREFRRFPDKRLPLSEYYDKDPKVADKLYINKAAYIDGFEFDWINRRIPKATVDSTDIVQWLTLEVADMAIQDAGYSKESIPKDRTGVIVGNSLTGEQSRATTMRIRWPFVKKALMRSAKAKGLSKQQAVELAEVMEETYKSVFPEVNEDNLQGGLSNTIAGRVSNYFDLHGGGFNVDGACASSLLAICTAADHLRSGNWDIAIAGGVDVSLDTFELIGFAKTSALTPDDMTVYDERGNGFLPGEGCGLVVLKRLKDAINDGDEIYSVIKGWGVSSDGKGGMTAPSNKGQSRALQRAYKMAGYGPGQLDFIEGHGTGTRVGDKTELEGISLTMEAFKQTEPRNCGVTSFKSIVGHTKAAAGVGAFIKAVMSVNRRIMPPTANCLRPNPVFAKEAKYLYPALQGVKFDDTKRVRAGVSAMGFGGINSHITLESPNFYPSKKLQPSVDESALLNSNQETELFVLTANDLGQLKENLQKYKVISRDISIGELTDLAAHLSKEIISNGAIRFVCKASNPEQLTERLSLATSIIDKEDISPGKKYANELSGIWISNQHSAHKVGFIFPGQGSQHLNMARSLVERFSWAKELVNIADDIAMKTFGKKLSHYLFDPVNIAVTEQEKKEAMLALSDTQIAQPAICLASIIYARYLQKLGIEPSLVAGHSLGELTAFAMSGMLNDRQLIEHAILRGQVMKAAANGKGTMASIFATKEVVEKILEKVDGYAVIANLNSPEQVVISGDNIAIEQALKIAQSMEVNARALNVSGAFHSKHMQQAAENFSSKANFTTAQREPKYKLFTGASGLVWQQQRDITEHFSEQMLQQVNFIDLTKNLSKECDILLEVGPGTVLTNLAKRIVPDSINAIATASTANNDQNLNNCIANYFIAGGELNWSQLFHNRLVRPFVPAAQKVFIENPCEREMSLIEDYQEQYLSSPEPNESVAPSHTEQGAAVIKKDDDLSTIDATSSLLIDMVATRTGYPNNSITLDSKLLDDLNLDSIKAGELIANFAKKCEVVGQIAANDYVNASLKDIVSAVSLGASSQDISKENSMLENSQVSVAINNLSESHKGSANDEVLSEQDDAIGLIKEMVEKRTGYPVQSIADTARLLDDLNLDSIKAGELVANFAKHYQVAGKIAANDYVNASLLELVSAVLSHTSTTQLLAVEKAEQNSDSKQIKPDAMHSLKSMIEQRTGYPLDSITANARLLDDLNLDSIKAGELVANFAQQHALAGKLAANDFVNATLEEIVSAVIKNSPISETVMKKQPVVMKTAAVDNPQTISEGINTTSHSDNFSLAINKAKKLVEQRTGYPIDSILDSSRLLDDLNLDSIKAGELITSFAKEYDMAGEIAANDYVNSSISEIVTAIVGKDMPSEIVEEPVVITNNNVESSVKNFIISYTDAPASNSSLSISQTSTILVLHEVEHYRLASEITHCLKEKGVNALHLDYNSLESEELKNIHSIIAMIPAKEGVATDYQKALELATLRLQTVVRSYEHCQAESVALLQFGGGKFATDYFSGTATNVSNSGFLRSWSLEKPSLKLRAIDCSENLTAKNIVRNLLHDLSLEESFLAVGYDDSNRRRMPHAIVSNEADYSKRELVWSENDLVLVTGGAKGITAECVVKLAETVKAKFILLGSSPLPNDCDSEIVTNLKRLKSLGITCRYMQCDLANKTTVTNTVKDIEHQYGDITGLVHGAGLNIPRLVSQVSAEQAVNEISPKLLGMQYLLEVLEDRPPKLIVGMSSIIGIAGMTGNAWYAYANEAMDLLLRQFTERHSQTNAVTLGYTVWKEVGMGHRLGVIDSLENSGVEALTVVEGTNNFERLFHYQAIDQQVAIIGQLTGLKTWQQLVEQATATVTSTKYRYLDRVVQRDEQRLTVRTELNCEKDPYLLDHDFNGSLLLPTVLGLEAMAQVANELVDNSDYKICQIANISLELPILVERSAKTEIEIEAKIKFQQDKGYVISVGISTENTGFASQHFSAEYHFLSGYQVIQPTHTIKQKELDINPKLDLYNDGGVLFQGEVFQRLTDVNALSKNDVTLAIEPEDESLIAEQAFADPSMSLLLQDPFYRDVLLQSVQLSLIPEFVLPVAIGKIDFYNEHQSYKGKRFVKSIIKKNIDRDYWCDVLVVSEQGVLLEKLTDYKVRALYKHSIATTIEQLTLKRDSEQSIVDKALKEACQLFGIKNQPSISIYHCSELHQLSKPERHKLEIPFVEKAIARSDASLVNESADIFWNEQGKPCLGNKELSKYDISISHDDNYCIVAFGDSKQACDIEIVKDRGREEWQGLIGNVRTKLLDDLISKGDSIDEAGIRIWSAIESAKKLNIDKVTEISLAQYKSNAVVLAVTSGDVVYNVLSIAVEPDFGDKRIISTYVMDIEETNMARIATAKSFSDIIEKENISSQLTYDNQLEQMVFEYDIQVGFKECGNLSRTVYYTHFLLWIGKVRELFMAEIADELVPQVASGDWGLVTNWAELNVFDEAKCFDKVTARFRLGKVYDSVIPLHCDFFRKEADGQLTPLAHVMQETTWVKIVGHGQVIPADFPPYFEKFLAKTDAKGKPEILKSPAHSSLNKGALIYQETPVPGASKPFYVGQFNTCFEDANLVGNIYYANYFIWQGRIRNNFLAEVIPDLLKGIGEQGELVCVRSRMDYLRDAMPFDRIYVTMSLKSLSEYGATLSYQFYRILDNGRQEKLSVGEQEVVWVKHSAKGKAVPSPLPKVLQQRLQVTEIDSGREVA